MTKQKDRCPECLLRGGVHKLGCGQRWRVSEVFPAPRGFSGQAPRLRAVVRPESPEDWLESYLRGRKALGRARPHVSDVRGLQVFVDFGSGVSLCT